jgi:hypothetical protein
VKLPVHRLVCSTLDSFLLWLTLIRQSALQTGHRVFVTTRGHSETLDEDAVDVRLLSDQDQDQYIHAN